MLFDCEKIRCPLQLGGLLSKGTRDSPADHRVESTLHARLWASCLHFHPPLCIPFLPFHVSSSLHPEPILCVFPHSQTGLPAIVYYLSF
jgi:hypothetical protein